MRKAGVLIFVSVAFVSASVAQQTNRAENIFIITLDGFRWQELFAGADSALILNKAYVKDPLGLRNEFWATSPEARRALLMPFFWSTIAKEGQLYGNRKFGNNVNCANELWFSYPGYNEILCGFSDDARIKTNNKVDNPNVTVLEFLNQRKEFKGKVAAFGSWDLFPFIINESRSNIPVNAGFDSASGKKLSERERFLNVLQVRIPSPFTGVRLDAFTHHYCLEYLKRNVPRVVYISYGETDDFAHAGQYDAYLTSARRTDAFIQELWRWVQSHPVYKDKTAFLITTDHGRGTLPLDTWRSHGRDIDGSDEIWIAIFGKGVNAWGELREVAQYYQNQVAKTVAALLGITYYNERKVGEVIDGVMESP